MKKRKNIRFLSILFCFMFLFFVGCDGGPSGLLGDDVPRSLDGVKVLSKPADYDFAEAVGTRASENYYSLFAREILFNLYNFYESYNLEAKKPELLKDLDLDNGVTYISGYQDVDKQSPIYTVAPDIYYLYDSLRYTIEKIVTNVDEDGNIISQNIILLENPWNWTVKQNWNSTTANTGRDTFFKALNFAGMTIDIATDSTKNNVSVNISELGDDWTSLYGGLFEQFIPNFREFYDADFKREDVDGVLVKKYAVSPYYQQVVEGTEISAVNFFQDALEYATYLFVLGYDYVNVDDNGIATPSEDAPLFDFTLTTDAFGNIQDMKVGGWGQPISVVDALGRVKAMYKELGGYVGVTEKNQQQVARFIKDKIIGQAAYEKNSFDIQMRTDPTVNGTTTEGDPEYKKFNRNYDQIIENIIDYACAQSPIGYDFANETQVNLDQSYLASQITDYKGDYFFMSYEDNDDSEMFRYIEAAEYQSMVLYPQDVDLNKPMTDLWLAFEYFEDPNPDKGLKFADSITINVGFRYFNSSANGGAGEYTFQGETQIEVKYGKNGTIKDDSGQEAMPDVNWVYICDFEDVANIHLDKEVMINTKFNNKINNGIIDPFAYFPDAGETSSILISGTNGAREYYKPNDSSSYGVFGSLNEQKFSVQTAGDEGCDFMEVYFDIVKAKGVLGVNYNFKVGLVMYATEEET